MRSVFTLPLAAVLLSACQTTGTEQAAVETPAAMPQEEAKEEPKKEFVPQSAAGGSVDTNTRTTGTDFGAATARRKAEKPVAEATLDSVDEAGAIVTEFRYPGTTEGSEGKLVVRGSSATYHDTYCGGRSNETGVVEGTKIDFDRMTYPVCGQSTPLWADVVVKGYDRATGCFDRLTFTWGYDRIERYNAYPTDTRCKTG